VEDFLSDNVEWLVLIVAYALERLQEISRRKKLKSESIEDVETDGSGKVKGKGAKVASFLFDLLPVVSRLKRRK